MGALPVYSYAGYTKTVIVCIQEYELTCNVTLICTTLNSAINNVYIPQLRSGLKEGSSLYYTKTVVGWVTTESTLYLTKELKSCNYYY